MELLKDYNITILYHPGKANVVAVEGKNFIVYCDASYSGLGAVLMQEKNVIAYASRQ